MLEVGLVSCFEDCRCCNDGNTCLNECERGQWESVFKPRRLLYWPLFRGFTGDEPVALRYPNVLSGDLMLDLFWSRYQDNQTVVILLGVDPKEIVAVIVPFRQNTKVTLLIWCDF